MYREVALSEGPVKRWNIALTPRNDGHMSHISGGSRGKNPTLFSCLLLCYHACSRIEDQEGLSKGSGCKLFEV